MSALLATGSALAMASPHVSVQLLAAVSVVLNVWVMLR